MPSITIQWDATLDERTCPICKALHGHTWTFTTPEPLPESLTANGQIVWNIGMGSRAHGHQRHNCRCKLLISNVDLSDVNSWLEEKTKELEEQLT